MTSLKHGTRLIVPSLLTVLALASSGCSLSPTATPTAQTGNALRGNVHGGQQPVRYAHVYLYAANTTGYGQPSVSLLSSTDTGQQDSMGAYVMTDANGDFSISNDYTCTPTTQVYLLSSGGDPGAGINASAQVMAILGTCPASGNFAGAIPYLAVNEVTTVAAAYAMAGFAVDSTHVSSSGSPKAQLAVANAFANAANLASIETGTALTTTPLGNGVAPQATINTIANIIASCVNSDGHSSPACAELFTNAPHDCNGGALPIDTATAAINIAHNPGNNVQALYLLPPPVMPFSPSLTSVPNDFTLSVIFSGGGLSHPSSIAIDSQGNVWAGNLGSASVTELASNGSALSPATGFLGTSAPDSISIDQNDHVWVADAVANSLVEYSPAGLLLSTAPYGFIGGGLQIPQGVAIDAQGNAWAASFLNTVSEFSPTGTPISSALGFVGAGLNGPGGIAADSDGGIWVPNASSNGLSGISKFSSAGVAISPVNGFLGGGVDLPVAVAIDASGNAWAPNINGNSITVLDSSGNPISPSTGFTGGGLHLPFAIAMDGASNAWIANYLGSTVSEFTNAGVAVSPSTGYTASTFLHPEAVAVDSSGNVWVASSPGTSITELIGAAVPVVTPISVAVTNRTLGTRP